MATRRLVPVPRTPTRALGVSAQGEAQVRASLAVGKEQRGSSSTGHQLPAREFPADRPPATVRVGVGMTINTGNFESLRLDVSVSLPCLPEEVDAAYEEASQKAAEYISTEEQRWLGNSKQR